MLQIKNRFTEVLILEVEDLTRADLRGADLTRADLTRADLRGADLTRADLRGANLTRANLTGANLRGADLTDTNLTDTNLTDTNLTDADLRGANLPIYCKWNVSYNTDGLIKIGCKVKSIEEWDLFFSGTKEFDTKRGTEEFKRIQANYEGVKAYVLFMSKN